MTGKEKQTLQGQELLDSVGSPHQLLPATNIPHCSPWPWPGTSLGSEARGQSPVLPLALGCGGGSAQGQALFCWRRLERVVSSSASAGQ